MSPHNGSVCEYLVDRLAHKVWHVMWVGASVNRYIGHLNEYINFVVVYKGITCIPIDCLDIRYFVASF